MGVGAGWQSLSSEEKYWESCTSALGGGEGRSQMVGRGKDSFPQLCNRALREWIQNFECVLSWVPAGMWTVNLSHHLSPHWPANNPCSSHLLPHHLLFSLYLHNIFHSPTFLSVYLSMVHLIPPPNVCIWPYFSLAVRPTVGSCDLLTNIIEPQLSSCWRYKSKQNSEQNRKFCPCGLYIWVGRQ